MLFVAHPVHTEAVTYISGRADSLALLFMLLCFIFYIKSLASRNVGVYIFMLLSYALGGCPKMGFPENRVLKINNLEHKNSRKSYSRTAS